MSQRDTQYAHVALEKRRGSLATSTLRGSSGTPWRSAGRRGPVRGNSNRRFDGAPRSESKRGCKELNCNALRRVCG